MSEHLNYIVLHDKDTFYVFERMGKQVPFEAYNPDSALGVGATYDEAVADSTVPTYMIEEKAYEVMFNGSH